MEMKFKHIIIFILLTTNSESEGTFYVSTTNSTWSNINCTLGQPPLTFDEKGIKTKIQGLYITNNQSVWVGYLQALVGFEYIGCARKENFISENDAIEDPGSCFYFCKSYFGIEKNKCYCFEDQLDFPANFTLNESPCIYQCNESSGVACGGKKHISIYKMNREVQIGNEKCAQYNPNNQSRGYLWKPCSDGDYPVICFNQSHIFKTDKLFPNWMEAANQCFMLGSSPTTYNNSKYIHVDPGSPLWTGVISFDIIFPFVEQLNYAKTKLGVLTYDQKRFVLSFTSDGNTNRQSLCTQGEATPLPGSTTPTEAHTTMQSGTTPGVASTTTEIPEQQERKQTSGVGVPVGVSVAVIVIIAAAVTVLVVLKRRKVKTPNTDIEIKKDKQNEDGTNDYTEIPEIKQANDNIPLRYSITEAQEKYAHSTYHVLEKDQKTDNKNDTKLNKDPQTDSHYNYPDMTDFIQDKINDQSADLGHGQYAHTYFVLEGHQKEVDSVDGTYNVTGAHKPKVDQETDNVYNKLDENYHATYDHLRKHVAKKQGSDETYDRKENAIRVPKPGGEPDNVYNHVPAVEESGTYNHVNVSSDAKGAVNDCV